MPQRLRVKESPRRLAARARPVAEATRSRIRRVRISKEVKQAPQVKILASDQRKMQACLQSIANMQRQFEELTESMRSANLSLLSLMKTYRLQTFENDEAVAKIERSRGRSSSVIDVAAFRELVDDEDFMASVKVLSEKAKAVVPGKELDAITETTPGKPGEPYLEVKRKA